MRGDSKPFLFWIGGSIPAEEKRNAEVIRCASYLTLMHGAKGLVIHNGHGGIKPTSSRHWSVYRGLAREVKTLFPVVIEPVQTGPSRVTVDPPSIDYSLRQFKGMTYLIACNTHGRTVRTTFRCADWWDGEVVELPFENRRCGCRMELSAIGSPLTPNITMRGKGVKKGEKEGGEIPPLG